MKSARKLLGLLLAVCLSVTGCAGKGNGGETDSATGAGTTAGAEQPPTEPAGTAMGLTLEPTAFTTDRAAGEKLLALVSEMRVGSVQLSFLISDLLAADGSVSEDAQNRYRPLTESLRASGVTELLVTVRGGYRADGNGDPFAFPYPDSDTGADAEYLQYMERYGEKIADLARAYPAVTHWQTGGGYDSGSDIAHPEGTQGGFYPSERAAINTDLAAAAKQAFAAGGVTAKVVLGAFRVGTDSAGAVNFLRAIPRWG